MKFSKLILTVIMVGLVLPILVFSQGQDPIPADASDNIMESAPKLFIDYNKLDMDYVRREVNFVNYVRDRMQADIYVLVTALSSASGGWQFTLTFTGKNDFAGMTDTLTFSITSFETQDQFRDEFVRKLKLGLIPYMMETPLAERLTIGFDSNGSIKDIVDKWDYWVFKLRLNGSISGEQLRDQYRVGTNLNADRITEEWKIRFYLEANYDEEQYDLEDDSTWTASSKSAKVEGSVSMALTSHWSLGLFSRVHTSTYSNIKMGYQLTPAIEYNIFPYSESTYRAITFKYYIEPIYITYNEVTIYEKTEEFLMAQGVQIDVEIKQSWGQIDIRGEYNSYLHDTSKRRFNINGGLSFNLLEGFALDLGGSYSKIHDQLSLPARDLEIEEILLRRTELATQYSFHFSFGISYTFGAIYNNIVNPRF